MTNLADSNEIKNPDYLKLYSKAKWRFPVEKTYPNSLSVAYPKHLSFLPVLS